MSTDLDKDRDTIIVVFRTHFIKRRKVYTFVDNLPFLYEAVSEKKKGLCETTYVKHLTLLSVAGDCCEASYATVGSR